MSPTSAEKILALKGRIDRLSGLPIEEHLPAYEVIHGDLTSALEEIEGL